MNKIILGLNLLSALQANAISFYSKGVDYYNIKKNESDMVIDWKKQLNPKNKLFYKGVNDMRIFVLANPTQENIENYKKWQELNFIQNEKFIKAYNKKENSSSIKQSRSYDSYFLTMYYESTCPYCKAMSKQLLEYKQLGLNIKLVKVDADQPEAKEFRTFRTVKLRPGEGDLIEGLKDKNGRIGVPFIVVDNKKWKTDKRFSGYQNLSKILR